MKYRFQKKTKLMQTCSEKCTFNLFMTNFNSEVETQPFPSCKSKDSQVLIIIDFTLSKTLKACFRSSTVSFSRSLFTMRLQNSLENTDIYVFYVHYVRKLHYLICNMILANENVSNLKSIAPELSRSVSSIISSISSCPGLSPRR